MAATLDLNKVYEEAQQLAAQGEFLKAADKYQIIIEKKPDLAEARVNQGACYFQAGDLDRALESFDDAIDLDSSLYTGHYNKAKILVKLYDFESAVPVLEQVVKLKGDLKIYEEYVHACNQAEMYAKALDGAAKGISAHGGTFSLQLHNERIFAFFKLGKAEDGLEDVQKIIAVKDWKELKPEQVHLYSSVLALKAHGAMKGGDYAKAAALFEQVNLVDPDSNRLYAHGICLLQSGRERDAIPYLERAVEGADANSWKMLAALGTAHTRSLSFEKGTEYLGKAMQFDEVKNDVTINFSYALGLMNLDRKKEARAPLQLVYDNDKTNWIAAAFLGAVMLENKEWENSIPVLEQSIASANGGADDTVYYNLGYAYLMLGELEKARDAFAKALDLNPNNTSAATAVEQLNKSIEEAKIEAQQEKDRIEKEQALLLKKQAEAEEQRRVAKKKEEERIAQLQAKEAEIARQEMAKQEALLAQKRAEEQAEIARLAALALEPKGPNYRIDRNGSKLGPVGKRIARLQTSLSPNSNQPQTYRRKSLELIPRGIAYKGAKGYVDWYNDQVTQKGEKEE